METHQNVANNLTTPIFSGETAVSASLQSLILSGTKLWLDSIDPQLVVANRALGATGATSNPIIVADLLKSGRFDQELEQLVKQGLDDHGIAWEMTDRLVRKASGCVLAGLERDSRQ